MRSGRRSLRSKKKATLREKVAFSFEGRASLLVGNLVEGVVDVGVPEVGAFG